MRGCLKYSIVLWLHAVAVVVASVEGVYVFREIEDDHVNMSVFDTLYFASKIDRISCSRRFSIKGAGSELTNEQYTVFFRGEDAKGLWHGFMGELSCYELRDIPASRGVNIKIVKHGLEGSTKYINEVNVAESCQVIDQLITNLMNQTEASISTEEIVTVSDLSDAVPVAWNQLYEAGQCYDGKRIQLHGFYWKEEGLLFESKCRDDFYRERSENLSRYISIGRTSSFVSLPFDKIVQTNGILFVEGTYEHCGVGLVGKLHRISSVKVICEP